MQPYLSLQYVICLQGDYPSRGGGSLPLEGEPFLGDVKAYGFNFAPRGWAACEGQLLPINQNQSLYSLLGTTYGGDGRTTFGLPDLRGRAAVDEGTLNGITTILGAKGGEESVTLTTAEIPSHNHQGQLVGADPSEAGPQDNLLAGNGANFTDGTPDVDLGASSIAPPTPNSQAHENMMPFMATNFCICIDGMFPSRN